MEQRPRAAESRLLDRPSLRFVLVAGTVSALSGAAMLVLLPRFGYELLETRSALFVFAALVQLALVYPARRVGVTPLANRTLYAAVLLGPALQIATVFVPALRELLGLTVLDARLWGLIAVAVLVSWAAAQFIGRSGGLTQWRAAHRGASFVGQ